VPGDLREALGTSCALSSPARESRMRARAKRRGRAIAGPAHGRGFGLIEVLAAMALAFLLILGTSELVALSLWAKWKGDIVSGMAQAASSKLETLKSGPFDGEALKAGTYAETLEDPTSRITLEERWTIEDVDPSQKRIRLDIAARGRPEAAAALVLYISRDLGFEP
jgi:hypothetical protein